MIIDYSIKVENISKAFSRKKYIFKDLNFEVKSKETFGIYGDNGSGKSTLLKIIANVINSNEGKVTFYENHNQIKAEKAIINLAYIAPYLNLWDEFTPLEHIMLVAKIKGIKFESEKSEYWLNKFNLWKRRNDQIKTFSSGMIQRTKFIIAFTQSPKMLLLDEPSSNLDNKGIDLIFESINEYSKTGLTIIATNDNAEKNLCQNSILIQ